MKNLYLFIGAILLMFSTSILAQQQEQVQSAFIYHFTKYMEWPESKQSGDFIIAVVGNDPIVSHLNSLATTKKVGVQTIVVKKFSSASAVGNCHMIFLSAKMSSQIDGCLAKAKQFNALLITERSGYGKKGSGINFVIIGGKPKFEINEAAIKASRIKVSAKLVHLGIKVG